MMDSILCGISCPLTAMHSDLIDSNHMVTAQEPKSRLSRYSRASRPIPLSLTRRDEDIRQALAEFNFLTASQICRLVFGSESAISYCRKRLKMLYHAHQVDRLFLFRSPHGSPRTVYVLKHRNPSARSQYFLEHSLAVTDFLLALRSLQRNGSIELMKVVSERELRKNPIRVRVGGEDRALVPDCYVSLHLHHQRQTYEMNWAVEVDRATETQAVFSARKVLSHLALAHGPFQQLFHSTALTVVIITTGGQKRVAALIQAVENTLGRLALSKDADLFRIGTADLASDDPAHIFLDPCFKIPFQQEPVALIPEL